MLTVMLYAARPVHTRRSGEPGDGQRFQKGFHELLPGLGAFAVTYKKKESRRG